MIAVLDVGRGHIAGPNEPSGIALELPSPQESAIEIVWGRRLGGGHQLVSERSMGLYRESVQFGREFRRSRAIRGRATVSRMRVTVGAPHSSGYKTPSRMHRVRDGENGVCHLRLVSACRTLGPRNGFIDVPLRAVSRQASRTGTEGSAARRSAPAAVGVCALPAASSSSSTRRSVVYSTELLHVVTAR